MGMKSVPRRVPQGKYSPVGAPTTADSMPTLGAAVLGLKAGQALDELVKRSLPGLTAAEKGCGFSTSWVGAARVVARLTRLGCYLELQVHENSCICRVLRVLPGNAV